MSRWIIAWMLLLLPLQFSWAAVASYCQHERAAAAPAVQHPGHHEHQHASSETQFTAKAVDNNSSDNTVAFSSDPDCHTCHGLGLGAIHHPEAPPGLPRTGAWAGPAAGPLAQLSPIPPDRPQWLRLA
jgi:hypothetical protein